MARRPRRALTIAGTDPLGGAGVCADAAVFRELGVEALTVPTALVAQSSRGVRGFEPSPLPIFRAMLEEALVDGAPDAIKVGMLASPELADAVAWARRKLAPDVPLVLDPVLAGGGPAGGSLARDGLVRGITALADSRTLLTPNAAECAALAGEVSAPRGLSDLAALAERLAETLGCAVLAKGGHIAPCGTDVLARPGHSTLTLEPGPLVDEDIHGTGCHLAAAIAGFLARGRTLEEAVRAGRLDLQGRMAGRRHARVGSGRPQFLHAQMPADEPDSPAVP